MRLLFIHADELEFEAKQKTPVAEETRQLRGAFKEALVVFTAVEEEDEANLEKICENAVREIEEVLEKVNAPRVVIYPYAHLSSSLASPESALRALKLVAKKLEERNREVFRVPFGWYKAFTLKCKGHPLSELSREVKAEEVPAKEEVKTPSEFYVLEQDGTEHQIKLPRLDATVLQKYPEIRQLLLSEELGQRSGAQPMHVKLMRKLELVDYEPASDVGHFRFYPKGQLIKNLLQDLAVQFAQELGAMIIETPVMYRESEKDIAGQVSRFHQRDYRIKLPGYSLLLRFAGDFGLFRMMKDVTMSYRHLPIRIFELTHSYRLEQRGECLGLKRLRAFTMPDLHCFCLDMQQALEEYRLLFFKYVELTRALGVDFVIVFRVTKEFYAKHKKFIVDLLAAVGRPALIEVLGKQKHYWVMKHEFQFIDSAKGNAQLATIQLDLEDSARYGIQYVDQEGKKRGCVILHSSPGSIERLMYALLEHAGKRIKEGKTPQFPLWLSPTQVRLIPVSGQYTEDCKIIAKELAERKIRADVDDRELTVSRKVRDAETEWIPYTLVFGEAEKSSGILKVRIRGEGTKEMTLGELVKEITGKVRGMPYRPLPLPVLLSKRPSFAGR